MAVIIKGLMLPANKRIEIALRYLYGVGPKRANIALEQTGVAPGIRTKDLTEDQATKLRSFIEKSYIIEGDLRREVLLNIKRLKEIGSYRGIRHSKHLPVRGQRTKTNTRTVRGNVRKTMGSGRKAPAQKT
ncbi:30S ribosomal protein S13 [Candidatus Uhrbacteria bacterium]|nr:30S ribosomal protein S13 [Candidatus Uhrbacteria bacterium]